MRESVSHTRPDELFGPISQLVASVHPTEDSSALKKMPALTTSSWSTA